MEIGKQRMQTKMPQAERDAWTVRPAEPDDHARIIAVLPDWWDGRDLTAMVPRVFLLHFHATSLIVEHGDLLVAFLIGFDSQSYDDEAYIHFAGVHPEYRGRGIGRSLYERFFERCRQNRRTVVRACTSPVNVNSIAFHRKMGFILEDGGGRINGIKVFPDYNKPGDHKVRFKIDLDDE